MDELVFHSKLESKSGDIILFSPACKSFDWFNNYEERGKTFKQIVNQI